MPRSDYLAALAATLPAGAEALHCGADGIAYLIQPGCVEPIDPTRRPPQSDLLPFIDAGHFTRYLIGAADSSDTNPSNATYKLGVVAAHRGFTPHAHGAEHFVLSTGYAACGLYDAQRDAVVNVRLTPGTLLHIPALMPHSFNNRSAEPLLLMVANTGMGIDHEDYAITAAQAAERAVSGVTNLDYPSMATALRRLERELPVLNAQHRMGWREQLARRLRAVAERLEFAR
ncbi:MAG: cupin domain-containing protein [Oscillochloris sp.]|nr:cupin domain-containing protein [Oscillochloris sp.]